MLRRRPILVIGIDGGTWKVFDPMMEQGWMPTLKSLKARGMWSVCTSVHPPVSPPAWASFMTGKNPGKHGIFDFKHYDQETDTLHLTNATHICSKTVWELLSDADRKVCVLNVPMTYPPFEVNGYVVSGFDTPSLKHAFTYPKQLREEILANIPGYRIYLDSEGVPSDDELCAQVIEAMDHNCRLALMCLGRERWDTFMINIQAIDWLQHRMWPFLEDIVSGNVRTNGAEAVVQCYRKLDEVLARLLEGASEYAMDVMLVSDHGFGPGLGQVFPNRILAEAGVIRMERPPEGMNRRSPSKLKEFVYAIPFVGPRMRKLREIYWQLRETGSDKRFIERLEQLSGRNSYFSSHACEWACILANAYGFIYRNPRYPRKETKEEYLMEIFAKIADPISGRPLFERVIPGKAMYPSDGNPSFIPDLVVVPQPWLKLSAAFQRDTIAEWSLPATGEHYLDGIFLFLSSNSHARYGRQAEISLMDVMPTIMSLQGVPIPNDVDGKPIPWLIEKDQHRYTKVEREEQRRTVHYHDDEVANLKKRLADLGYL